MGLSFDNTLFTVADRVGQGAEIEFSGFSALDVIRRPHVAAGRAGLKNYQQWVDDIFRLVGDAAAGLVGRDPVLEMLG